MTKIAVPWHGWVVVCDGAKALILQNAGDKEEINLTLVEHFEEGHAPTSELGTDKPGRVQESATTGRSAVAETNLHDQAETDFLTRLVTHLAHQVQEHDIRHVVLVAPPRALGVLRAKLPPALAALVHAEIDKDLVKLPIYEIEKHITGA